MADPETPERILDDPSIQRAIGEVRRVASQPDVIFRSLLIHISKPMAEFVALLVALLYHVGLDAASDHFPTPNDRIQAVTADLDVLIRELEDIERSENNGADLTETIARERRLLTALRGRLERAAIPGLRRRKRASKSK